MMDHDGCVGCKYENEPETFEHCYGCTQNAIDRYTPLTNAGRIRAMSDEELAEFLLSWVECDKEEYMCAPTGRNRLGTCNGRCINGRINWLQQPAEEG